ncbi:MAG TPA: hypothetical protein VG676_05475 [Chitinophagaceae bacterium]|nr:hypothetical protein [Chitinophagaceae bacterium]
MTIRKVFLTVFAALVSGVSGAQEMQDIFDRKASVTWLGLDFTGARFIGDRERFGSASDVQHLIEAWNDLLITESTKFDVAAAIDKIKTEDAIDVTKDHNAALDVSDIVSSDMKDHFHLKPNDIEAIVADYDFKGNTGIGVMFNVESFSKLNEEGAIWITFIDMNRKTVFFSERLTGKPSGFGLRNYWAGAVYGILKKMEKKEFEMWRKKYFRKN